MSTPAKLRCAIYTRKSTEEGLDQEFNSLDAQREACEAFITSQASLGWKLTPDRYDDGGISGGTMERPALQRLLHDIRDGKVDVVVVYKIDRLTRSLPDFSKIVEVFDAQGVSFVSVTQQFNTTTSMGRLTLNVLLSFAQFEREVAAERIRDKVTASKKRGMWMGGTVPTGYRVENKKLIPESTEADAVRAVFQRYLELGSVRDLLAELKEKPLISESAARPIGWSKGKLYNLLSNPIYVGKVRHKKDVYDGEHEPIVDQHVFDKTQALLAQRAPDRRAATNESGQYFLAGILFSESGSRLSPVFTTNHGKRYRYYVESPDPAQSSAPGWRLPADRLERAVLSGLRTIVSTPSRLVPLMETIGLSPAQLQEAVKVAKSRFEPSGPRAEGNRREVLASLIHRAVLGQRQITLTIRSDRLADLLFGGLGDASLAAADAADEPHLRELTIPLEIRRRGVEARIVVASEEDAEPDPVLIDLIGRAHLLLRILTDGSGRSMGELAAETGIHIADVSRLLPLAFLSPKLTDAILSGRQPAELTGRQLSRLDELPIIWTAQADMLVAA